MNRQEPQPCQTNRQSEVCDRLMPPGTGIVVVGHGTADPIGAAETADTVAQVAAILPNVPVELGYLEVIEPTIAMAVERLADRGCKKIIAIPILLFAAGHAKQDIPQALQEAVARHGLSVMQADPLGLHEQVISLARHRFYEAIEGLAPIEGGSEALLIIGRGSSDPTASHQLWSFVRSTYSSLVSVAKYRFAISFVAAAKPKRKKGKKGVYKNPERSATLHQAIEQHRNRLIVLSNDKEFDWDTSLRESVELKSHFDTLDVPKNTFFDITYYPLESVDSQAVLKDMNEPGTSLLVRFSQNSADKVDYPFAKIMLNKIRDIGCKAQELGGSCTMILDRSTLQAKLALMNKLIMDWGLDRVSEAGRGAINLADQGPNTVLTNSTYVRSWLRGFDYYKRTKQNLFAEMCQLLTEAFAEETELIRMVLHHISRDSSFIACALARQCAREVGRSLRITPMRANSSNGRPSPEVIGGSGDDSHVIPAGMCVSVNGEHRDTNPDVSRVCLPLMVAKKIPKSEWHKPEISKALKAELDKVLNIPWPKCSKRSTTAQPANGSRPNARFSKHSMGPARRQLLVLPN